MEDPRERERRGRGRGSGNEEEDDFFRFVREEEIVILCGRVHRNACPPLKGRACVRACMRERALSSPI